MKNWKIAFTGPESSGKTTMANWLSQHLSFDLVTEYAREYLSKKRNYDCEDLNKIAREQFKRNEVSTNLIIDTEMLIMKVWCEEKYNSCSKPILELLERQKIDYYFLCMPDIPWEDDPLRENPLDRERLFRTYINYVNELGFNYSILEGDLHNRKDIIKSTLQKIGL